jgi:hypothetical protein
MTPAIPSPGYRITTHDRVRRGDAQPALDLLAAVDGVKTIADARRSWSGGLHGSVHFEALWRLGVGVVGVVGSSPERAREKACEKPLGIGSRETGELLAAAERSGLVHAVNFNVRFYPQWQRRASASPATCGSSRVTTCRTGCC